jgi:hypothetical protein
MVVFRVGGEGYGFVDMGDEEAPRRIEYLSSIDQLVYLKHLGAITCFYIGLAGNDVKLGVYYPPSTLNALKQFEFGTIQEDLPFCRVNAISMYVFVDEG